MSQYSSSPFLCFALRRLTRRKLVRSIVQTSYVARSDPDGVAPPFDSEAKGANYFFRKENKRVSLKDPTSVVREHAAFAAATVDGNSAKSGLRAKKLNKTIYHADRKVVSHTKRSTNLNNKTPQ